MLKPTTRRANPRGWPYPWAFTPIHHSPSQIQLFSSSTSKFSDGKDNSSHAYPNLTHVSPSGSARMVSISSKRSTSRVAVAVCTVHFSNTVAATLILDNQMKKGDVLGVARVAGIMASKRTPDLIPLCHPIAISHVSVDLEVKGGGNGSSKQSTVDTFEESGNLASTESGPKPGRVEVRATVECDGKTGVEMEALTAATTAALTIYDMCKAVDKGMRIDGARVVLKDGGKSGRWEESNLG